MTTTLEPTSDSASAHQHQYSWSAWRRRVRDGRHPLPPGWSYPEQTARDDGTLVYLDTDAQCPFPSVIAPLFRHWSVNYPNAPRDIDHTNIVLLHAPVVLPPGNGETQGYEIGPFYVSLHLPNEHITELGVQFVVAQVQGDDPYNPDDPRGARIPSFYGAHPNAYPRPCFGRTDYEGQLRTLASIGEWDSLLFVITRFLSSWNPYDHPNGHPASYARSRPVWTGPDVHVGLSLDDEGVVECVHCGEIVLAEESRYGDGDYMCERCYDNRYTACTQCGTVLHADAATVDHNDETVCNVCFRETSFTCDFCDTAYARAERVTVRTTSANTYHTCADCAETHFAPCPACGETAELHFSYIASSMTTERRSWCCNVLLPEETATTADDADDTDDAREEAPF